MSSTEEAHNNEVIDNNNVGNNLTGPLRIESRTNLKCISLNKLKIITSLTISQCSQLTKIDLSELTELTKLECSNGQLTSLCLSNNIKLAEINCSRNQLAELDVSDCPKLVELNCSYNSIENLILNLCPKITKLNCSNNQLIDLEISNCSKLGDLDCSHNRLIGLDLSNCSKFEKAPDYTHNQPNLNIIREKGENDKIRNLLIIGHTRVGKSTLANVLSDTDDFEESEYSASKTKNFRKKEFEWKETKYRVVDTVRIEEKKTKQVLLKIAEGIYSMPEGISQFLYVVDKEFTTAEVETFKLFEKVMFESGILQYVTIVKTKFNNFKNPGEREKDKDQFCNESKTIADSCNDIIYVDNPSTNIKDDDDDDQEIIKIDKNTRIKINKNTRAKSRTILLEHLEKICREKPYKPKTWDEIRNKIAKYLPAEDIGSLPNCLLTLNK